jgi:hypothetical protein
MPEVNWTPSLIEERFIEAADVMKRLPDIRVPGYFNTWPRALREFGDLIGQEPQKLRRPPPSPDAISRMDETLSWLVWLEPSDRKLIWLRANGERWKVVCWKLGLARSAAHQRWLYGLCVIALRLNNRKISVKWPRYFVIAEARRAG